jgi:hypothetical protein
LILSCKILKKESGVFPTQERLSWLWLVINSIQGFLDLLTPFNLPGLLTPTLKPPGTPNTQQWKSLTGESDECTLTVVLLEGIKQASDNIMTSR